MLAVSLDELCHKATLLQRNQRKMTIGHFPIISI